VKNFHIHHDLPCHFPKKARRLRWFVPSSLKNVLLRCFHDGISAGHLVLRKTLGKVASYFWWPGMRNEVSKYVQECELCQRAKPAQNTRVGLHSAEPPAQPMEKFSWIFWVLWSEPKEAIFPF
jgi:hypothetical protein